MTPLTVPEARAILAADEALDATYESRVASGKTLGAAEGDAWRQLVESATARIAAWGPKIAAAAAPVPYSGGNEPDFQTLFAEAAAAGTKRETEDRDGMLSVLACREGPQWVVQAIEQDVASQGPSLLGALADLGRMLDARDRLLTAEQNVAPLPRAPVDYERAVAEGHQVGVLPLGRARAARVYVGISPFEQRRTS